MLEELFTKNEKNELNKFVNNEALLKAVERAILLGLYFDETLAKSSLEQPTTGLSVVKLIEQGFKKLQIFNKKEQEPKGEKSNPAR